MSSYPLVLSGIVDPKEALFPEGNYDEVMPLILKRMRSTDAQAYIALAAQCVRRVAEVFQDRPIRILEIGGGEGLLTWPVIEMLQERVAFEYVFTDIGRTFVLRAEREARRRNIKQMSFREFNFLEDSPVQGLASGSFDLILAFNVVHVAPEIRSGISAIAGLLAPGGCLCLLEGTTMARPAKLFWGLEAGLWDFTDSDLRQHSALLSQRQWQEVLSEVGFSTQVSFPDPLTAESGSTDHCLFICQRPKDLNAPLADPRIQAIRRQGSDVEFQSYGPPAQQHAEEFDGVFWIQSEEKCEITRPCPSELVEAAQSAVSDTLQLQSFVHRSGARFCCIISPDPGGRLSLSRQMASIAAEQLIANCAHESGTEWRRIIWDSFATERFSASEADKVLRCALSSTSASTFYVPSPTDPRESLPARQVHAVRSTNSNSRPQLTVPYVPPSNEMEEAVTRIWEEILGVQGLGVNDDFFEIGGESLIATQLATRIRDTYGVKLSLKSLFMEPTIGGVCRLIEESTDKVTEAQSETQIPPAARQSRKAKRSVNGVVELQA